VEGVEKMKCLIGMHKGNRAVQVTEIQATSVDKVITKKEATDG